MSPRAVRQSRWLQVQLRSPGLSSTATALRFRVQWQPETCGCGRRGRGSLAVLGSEGMRMHGVYTGFMYPETARLRMGPVKGDLAASALLGWVLFKGFSLSYHNRGL